MDSASKTRIIGVSQKLFFQHGFRATSLGAIADELGIKPASLYYHFPGGKEELYIAVLQSQLQSYRNKIEDIAQIEQSLDRFLHAFAHWYIDQPPMNMALISQMDMPYLTPKAQRTVMETVSKSIFQPIAQIIAESKASLKPIEPIRLVGIYLTLLNGMSFALKQNYTQREKLIEDFISVLLHGIWK